jgi:iron(II)-dependent oxidoreductase
MAGNVKEWVDDWFDREYYNDSSSQTNPKGPIGGEFKVLRGGSWRDLKGFIYSSFRNNSYPDTRLDDYGFRCAKSTTKDQSPKKLTRLEGFSKANGIFGFSGKSL